MSIDIRLKHSSVNGKVPQPTDLSDGELALNTNAADPAIYLKDSAGAVRRVDAGAVPASDWTRTGTVISPTVAGDDVTTTGDVNAANVVATGDVQAASLNSGPLAGFRNQIINGDFRVWQRGEDQTLTGSAAANFGPDRWFLRAPNSVGGTSTEVKISRTSEGNRCRIVYNGTPTGKAFIAQRIETQNIKGLYGKQLTLSFDFANVSMGTAPTPTVTIIAFKTTGSTVIVGEADPITNVVGTKRIVTFTYATDDNTVAADDGIGMLISININGGATVPSGACELWNVQLEPGPVATPFEHRPYGTELALCQRYYEIANLEFAATGVTGARVDCYWAFKVNKRATPTVVLGLGSAGNLIRSDVEGAAIRSASAGSQVSFGAKPSADAEL